MIVFIIAIIWIVAGIYSAIYDKRTEEILFKEHGLFRVSPNNFMDYILITILGLISLFLVIRIRRNVC